MRRRRRISVYGRSRDRQGRVLLVRGSPSDDLPGWWGLPGGGVEHGEAPNAALIREYAEETGLTVAPGFPSVTVTDVALRPDRGETVHTDRIIYDIAAPDGQLHYEAQGSSDRAEWIDGERLAQLPLYRYAAQALGLPGGHLPGEIPRNSVGSEPAGSESDVVARATRRQRFAAYGLVTEPGGRVLLTRIADGYPGAGSWHPPGGGTDFGESATEGLLRELVEETSQRGRIVELLTASSYHNPAAVGPEGYPIDWHTVRVLFRVVVDLPGPVRLTEAAGGSTAEAGWFSLAEAAELPCNDFARSVLAWYPH